MTESQIIVLTTIPEGTSSADNCKRNLHLGCRILGWHQLRCDATTGRNDDGGKDRDGQAGFHAPSQIAKERCRRPCFA